MAAFSRKSSRRSAGALHVLYYGGMGYHGEFFIRAQVTAVKPLFRTILSTVPEVPLRPGRFGAHRWLGP